MRSETADDVLVYFQPAPVVTFQGRAMACRSNYSNLKYHPTVLMNIDDFCSAIFNGAFVQVQVVR